jgi:hypothetical protein
MRSSSRTGGIGDVDLDVFPLNSLHGGDSRPGRADQSGWIFGCEQEGEGHLTIFRDAQVPDHSSGEKIVIQPRILDAGQRSRDPSFEGFQDLDRLDVLHFGHHLAEPALDTLLQRNG